MSHPTCTVVVPAHGRPRALARCLEALARLDYPADRLDVVVVDDGSPDPLRPAVEAMRPGAGRSDGAPRRGSASTEPAVRWIRQENAGPAAARNRGARAGTARFVAFTDDDCEPEAGWLARLVEALAEDPDALVGGRTVNALPDNPWSVASQQLVSYLYDYYLGPEEEHDGPRPGGFLTSNNLAAAREAFLEAGGFDERFPDAAAEDRELCRRWRAGGGRLRYEPEAVVRHSHHLDALSFLKQHHRYGRGARRLHEAAGAGDGAEFEGPAFYAGLLRWPLGRLEPPEALVTAALLALSQVAAAAGYVREAVRGVHR